WKSRGPRTTAPSLPLFPGSVGGPDPRSRHTGPRPALAALQDHAAVLRARRHAGDLAAVPAAIVRYRPRPLACAARAVRMGGAEGVRGGDGHALVRRRAAVGEESRALAYGVPAVGRQDFRSGRGDLLG